jgi:hypothetical protein
MTVGSRTMSVRAFATLALIAFSSSVAVSSAAEILQRPAELWMLTPVIDRPEMRSFQPYSGLQFGFRPTPPIQRGVKSKRPKVIMPKRVAPLIEFDRATPNSAQGYAYCPEPPGNIEPRTGPYDPAPSRTSQCP